MKILFPCNKFPGGFQKSIMKAFLELGHEVFEFPAYKPSLPSRLLYRLDKYINVGLRERIKVQREKKHNHGLLEEIKSLKPDIFFTIIGQGFHPQTFKHIKENLGTLNVSYVADNPCDPNRNKYFAMSLRYMDVLLYPEDTWLKILDKIAPNVKKIKFLGGYDPDLFFPVNLDKVKPEKINDLSHDIVFTGGSYGESAEGAYRAGILGQLAEEGYNVRIWGDRGWEFRIQFYPQLKGKIITNRLSYEELRILLRASKIYLNMPSPQIFTSFQPRVFEIAATKGFQIIDHSADLASVFGNDFVSFHSYADLKDKLDYYISHPVERKRISEKMYKIVREKYTWKKQLEQILPTIMK